MQNKILFGAVLFAFCTLSMNMSAQIEVETSGDVTISGDVSMSKNVTISKKVAINGANLSNTVALNIKAPFITSVTNAYGIYSSIKQSHPGNITSGYGVGVLGCTMPYAGNSAQQRPSPFYAGIVGMSSSWVGVYGTTASALPNVWTDGCYAGYFEGDVKVNGCVTATHVVDLSDQRLLENITQFGSKNATDIFSKLNPVSFTLRNDSTQNVSQKVTTMHYGFVAQELQQIAPELVYKDGAGYLYINYTEMIPLLVQKVQELSAEVEELKGQINENR